MQLSKAATGYILGIVLTGTVLIARAVLEGGTEDYLRTAVYLGLTILASAMKFRLPGVTGTYSLSFLLILVGIVDLSFREVVLLSCVAAVVQTCWRPQQPPPLPQVGFNIGNIVISASVAHLVFHNCPFPAMKANTVALLALTAAVYFAVNALLVSVVLCLVERKPLNRMWEHWVFWAFPYYLAGAVLAGAVSTANSWFPWWTSLPSLSLAYLCHRWYRVYVERGANQRSI